MTSRAAQVARRERSLFAASRPLTGRVSRLNRRATRVTRRAPHLFESLSADGERCQRADRAVFHMAARASNVATLARKVSACVLNLPAPAWTVAACVWPMAPRSSQLLSASLALAVGSWADVFACAASTRWYSGGAGIVPPYGHAIVAAVPACVAPVRPIVASGHLLTASGHA
jgi:hypothetical protein